MTTDIISSEKIRSILEITDSLWLLIDIKSIGSRDDQDHVVMSHNQMSGHGKWTEKDFGRSNFFAIVYLRGGLKERYWYMSKEKELGKKKSIAAIARRFAELLYTPLRNRTEYEVRTFSEGRKTVNVETLVEEALAG
jgi:hypothetical protein